MSVPPLNITFYAPIHLGRGIGGGLPPEGDGKWSTGDKIFAGVCAAALLAMGAGFGAIIYEGATNSTQQVTSTFNNKAVLINARQRDQYVEMRFAAKDVSRQPDGRGKEIVNQHVPYTQTWFKQGQQCQGTYNLQHYYKHTGKSKGWKTSLTEATPRTCISFAEVAKSPAKQAEVAASRHFYKHLFPKAQLGS